MTQQSILQSKSVRDRGEYKHHCPVELINVLDRLGARIGAYSEQTYYVSTRVKGTSKHGQYMLSFLREDCAHTGITISGSHDCQLALAVHYGLAVHDRVIPILPLCRYEHRLHADTIDREQLIADLQCQINEYDATMYYLDKARSSPEEAIEAFEALNRYRVSIGNYGWLEPQVGIPLYTKLSVLALLIRSFVLGRDAVNVVTGRKPRAVTHIRRIIQIADRCMMQVVNN